MADTDPDRARLRARRWATGFTVLAGLQASLLIATGHLFEGFGPTTMAARATLASFGSYILVTLVVCQAGHRWLAPLRSAPLVYLGTISYGIYLYHYPIINISARVSGTPGEAPGLAVCAIDCALTLLVAAASWQLVERPVLRLKDRLPYRRDIGVPEHEGLPTRVPVAVEMSNLSLGQAVPS
jgi:peptidoglycan/LPS O-acetylase OafA/YrhL